MPCLPPRQSIAPCVVQNAWVFRNISHECSSPYPKAVYPVGLYVQFERSEGSQVVAESKGLSELGPEYLLHHIHVLYPQGSGVVQHDCGPLERMTLFRERLPPSHQQHQQVPLPGGLRGAPPPPQRRCSCRWRVPPPDIHIQQQGEGLPIPHTTTTTQLHGQVQGTIEWCQHHFAASIQVSCSRAALRQARRWVARSMHPFVVCVLDNAQAFCGFLALLALESAFNFCD